MRAQRDTEVKIRASFTSIADGKARGTVLDRKKAGWALEPV